MIVREQGDTVPVVCGSCKGDGRSAPGPVLCDDCDGDGVVVRRPAEPIRVDAAAISEQLAQQRGGA